MMVVILKYDGLSEAEPMEHYERGCELPAPELANRRAPHRAGHVASEKGRPARAHPGRSRAKRERRRLWERRGKVSPHRCAATGQNIVRAAVSTTVRTGWRSGSAASSAGATPTGLRRARSARPPSSLISTR